MWVRYTDIVDLPILYLLEEFVIQTWVVQQRRRNLPYSTVQHYEILLR
jgi:hypothetical protein